MRFMFVGDMEVKGDFCSLTQTKWDRNRLPDQSLHVCCCTRECHRLFELHSMADQHIYIELEVPAKQWVIWALKDIFLNVRLTQTFSFDEFRDGWNCTS